jgi:hypothetical protein
VNRLVILCASAALAAGISSARSVRLRADGHLAQQLPEPRKQFGAGVTGAFEGWFTKKDGSRWFLVGYYNRNSRQDLEVPVGPDNRIEPGGPDMGQPTHFLPGRQTGMFVVPVPKTFGPDDRLTWTIVANGQSASIPLRLHPDYVIDPFTEVAIGNTPPVVRFEERAAGIQGPIAQVDLAPARTASVASPMALTLWAADDMKYLSSTGAPVSGARPPVTITWSKYRGPGAVAFDKARPPVEKLAESGAPFSGKASTTATFSEPGEYLLHVTANDYSGEGGGGFVCCWTTALLKVNVR